MAPGLFSLYAGAPPAVQAHIRGRWLTCPFAAVAGHVPPEGRVLEVGSGFGLFSLHLALGSPGRSVFGIDVDARKVVLAQRAAKRAAARGATCAFELAPPGDVPDPPWDAIAIVDVLYLLDADDQAGLMRTCASSLAAGGVLVVKEMAPEPRWKARWNHVQETGAVRVLRITAGDSLTFLPPATIGAWMAQAGLTVTHVPLDRGYPHPHHLIVGRRPTLADLLGHGPGGPPTPVPPAGVDPQASWWRRSATRAVRRARSSSGKGEKACSS